MLEFKLAYDFDSGDRCRVVSFRVAAGRGGVSLTEEDGDVRRTGYSRGNVDVGGGGGGVLEGAASLGERRIGHIGIHQLCSVAWQAVPGLTLQSRQKPRTRQVEHVIRCGTLRVNGTALHSPLPISQKAPFNMLRLRNVGE